MVSKSMKKVKVYRSRRGIYEPIPDVSPTLSRALSTEVLSSRRILKYILLRHDKMLFSVDATCIYKAKGDSKMAQVEFYDVKTRAKVKIDDKNITKVKMDTKSGPRYAIKGKTADGRNLTKFVGAADWEKLKYPVAK